MSRSIFKCIDAHTCGNPVRMIVEGGPELSGSNMSEKRQNFLSDYDWIRKGLMYEPRGHDMMSGSILYPSQDPENDLAILFIETSGCLPMCGHGTIGTITIAIEEGIVIPREEGKLKIETPAGVIEIIYAMKKNKVEWVKMLNVKSYLAAEGLHLETECLGDIIFDVAYGGNFYAIVDPQKNFKGIQHYKAAELISFSQEIRTRINQYFADEFVHPENETIRNVSHILWTGATISSEANGRNAVFYGDKAIDRSPCGTGTSARMAQLCAKGALKEGDQYIHESFIGSQFVGKIESITKIGTIPAIIPSIKGWARIFGYNTIIIDDEDPYAHGFEVI